MVQRDLWEMPLTKIQKIIIDEYLERDHPQLLIATNLWRKKIPKAIG
jgi:hypothetical protein